MCFVLIDVLRVQVDRRHRVAVGQKIIIALIHRMHRYKLQD